MTAPVTEADEPYDWEPLYQAELDRIDELAERRRPWWKDPDAFHALGCDCPACMGDDS